MSEHPVRRMLDSPAFRQLLAVRLSGQLGDGLFQGALFGAAFFNPEKATSAGAAAAAFATLLLPYSLVGPFAGVLLDRWSRQRVLLLTNLGRGALVVVLAQSLLTNGPTSATTVGLALLVVSLNRFVLSGLSAALPHVVDPAQLVTGNALTTTLGTGAAAVGGFASVGLRELWGKGDGGAARIALVGVLAYLLAGGLAGRLGARVLGPDLDTDPPPWRHAMTVVARGFTQGAQHLRHRPRAAHALLAMTAHRFFSGLLFVSTLLLYTPHGYLHRGFAGLGQTLTLAVVGGFLAALVTPRVTRRTGQQRWIVLALGGAATVTVTLVPWWRHPTMLAAGLGLGFATQAAKICVDTLLQSQTADDFRGRVFALYDMLFNVSFVAAAVLAAGIVPDDGRSLAVLGLAGLGFAATALVYGLASRVTAAAVAPPTPSAGAC